MNSAIFTSTSTISGRPIPPPLLGLTHYNLRLYSNIRPSGVFGVRDAPFLVAGYRGTRSKVDERVSRRIHTSDLHGYATLGGTGRRGLSRCFAVRGRDRLERPQSFQER